MLSLEDGGVWDMMRDGPLPEPCAEWLHNRWRSYLQRKCEYVSKCEKWNKANNLEPETPTSSPVAPARTDSTDPSPKIIIPSAWNTFWGAFASNYLGQISVEETLQALSKTNTLKRLRITLAAEQDPITMEILQYIQACNDAHVMRSTLLNHVAQRLVPSILTHGAIEFFDVTFFGGTTATDGSTRIVQAHTVIVTVQMTTEVAAQAVHDELLNVLPLTSTRIVPGWIHQVHRMHGEDVCTNSLYLSFPTRTMFPRTHFEEVFGLITPKHSISDGLFEEGTNAHNPPYFLVSFENQIDAQMALHVLQQPLAFDWSLRLAFTKHWWQQASVPTELAHGEYPLSSVSHPESLH